MSATDHLSKNAKRLAIPPKTEQEREPFFVSNAFERCERFDSKKTSNSFSTRPPPPPSHLLLLLLSPPPTNNETLEQFWRLGCTDEGAPTVSYAGSAGGSGGARHSRGVNCVRFSPEGARLATGGDGGELYLWRKGGGAGGAAGGAPAFGADPSEEPGEGDEWRVVGMLR